jgi:hypothetical protein
LTSSGQVPVLVVALCDDGEERAAFFQALAADADQAPLITPCWTPAARSGLRSLVASRNLTPAE